MLLNILVQTSGISKASTLLAQEAKKITRPQLHVHPGYEMVPPYFLHQIFVTL